MPQSTRQRVPELRTVWGSITGSRLGGPAAGIIAAWSFRTSTCSFAACWAAWRCWERGAAIDALITAAQIHSRLPAA